MKCIVWIDSLFTTGWHTLKLAAFLLCIVANTSLAQTIETQCVYSAGTTTNAAVGGGYRLYASVGQPIASQKTPPTATSTNAGFMQVTDAIIGDKKPPTVLQLGNLSLTKNGVNSVSISVTDIYFVDASSVQLHHRNISGKDFTAHPMTKGNGNEFNLTVSDSWYDAMGMEYYFSAKDLSGNEAITTTKYAYLKDPDVIVPQTLCGFGSKVTDYRTLSLPYQVTQNGVNQIFDELGGSDKSKYRIWQYANGEWKEFPSDFTTLNRAEGFFIIMAEGFSDKNLSLGEQTAPSNNRSDLYEITLKPGWNLIGNPYTVPVHWEDVQTFNEEATPSVDVGELKIYNGASSNNGYSFATSGLGDVAPFQGGFLFVEGSVNQTITIPFKGQTTAGGRIASRKFGTDLSEEQWRVDLKVSRHELMNSLGGFGMHPNASIEKDRYDDFNPPHFDQFVEVNFPHPEHPLKNFSRDIVTTHNEYVWSFKVDADADEETSLTWSNSDFGPNSKELFLYDEANNQVVNMREVNTYTFKALQSTTFKIYFGVDVQQKIVPEKLFVGAPYPNPLLSENSVAFDLALPDHSSYYYVSVEIFNAQGLKVATDQKQTNAGRGKYEIDLAKFNLVSGVYFYRMVIIASNFQQAVNGKLIVR